MDEFGLALSAPLHVELALTSVCQLRCRYCSAMPFSGSIAQHERVLKLIEELGGLRVFSLLLSGGEPTIHPHFLQILRASARNISEVMVNTNGIRLADPAFAREFHCAAPTAIAAISLDSPDIAINDLHRGAGGMDAIKAIDEMSDLGQPVCISTVMTGDNFDSADALIDRFFPKVRAFRFFPRVPRSHQDVVLTDTTYSHRLSRFFEKVNLRASTTPKLKVITPFTAVNAGHRGIIFSQIQHCCCAFTKAYITSDLDVFPCYYSSNCDTRLGSLTEETFADLWEGQAAQSCRNRARQGSLCELSLLSTAIPHRYKNLETRRTAEESTVNAG